MDSTSEIFLPFFAVKFIPLRKVFVFGMIQQQILDVKFLRKFASVLYRRMILAIGVEDVSLRIKAKRLVQQPISISGVNSSEVITRLVAATRQLSRAANVH